MQISTPISIVLLVQNSFKWQYMDVAGAGAGAEIMEKGGAGYENKLYRLRNTAIGYLQIEQRMLVLVPPEDILEEGTAGAEHHLVRRNLRILAGQCHVKEVLVLAQLPQSLGDARPKVVPLQTKFFRRHCTVHHYSLAHCVDTPFYFNIL